jgi:hypothetical protein
MIDEEAWERDGKIDIRYPLPTSDADRLSDEEKRRYAEDGIPLEFSHTLEEQIDGQCEAGFAITGMYEDGNRPEHRRPLTGYTPVYIATRAVKG